MGIQNNNSFINNQENYEEGCQVTKYVYEGNTIINNNCFQMLRSTIQNSCEKEVQDVIMPFVDEMENEQKKGNLHKRDRENWLKRIKGVVDMGSGIATIASAPWWPAVSNAIREVFTNLP